MLKPLCLSGGAIGADTLWGDAATYVGHDVIHFSFCGHSANVPESQISMLTDAELKAADQHCQKANIILQRKYPPKSLFVRNLLRRDWYQVRDAESVYAISTIKKGLVQGGTGWAATMFLDRYNWQTCPIYVFDQVIGQWFHWKGSWEPIYEPPFPQGVWAGIGSRDINTIGRLAIYALMNYWPRQHTIWQKNSK